MDCREARRLLDQGVVPSASDAMSQTLGFHLSGCATCRAHRQHAIEQELLFGLLAQHPYAGVAALPRRVRRQGDKRMRVASAAFLVSSALAVVPSHTIAPVIVAPVQHSSVAAMVAAAGAPAAAPAVVAASAPSSNTALLSELLADPVEAPSVASLQVELATARSARLAALQELATQAAPAAAVAPVAEVAPVAAVAVAPVAEVAPVAVEADALAMGEPIAVAELPVGVALALPAFDQPSAPADSAPADVVAQTAPLQYYTVLPGDSLWSIAARVLGNPLRWQEIWRANGSFANPDLIYANQVFALPSGVGIGVGPGSPTNPIVAPGPIPVASVYTVVRGDSLWDIARRAYGNPLRWQDIYRANAGQIANPHWIYPGQQFTIPR